jgi:hypothetical protein
MALTKCHECRHVVSTQAKACPTCGAQAKKPSGARLGLFLLAVLGVFGLIGLTTRDRATSDLQSGPPAQAPTPTSTTPPAPDPLMTTTTAEPRRSSGWAASTAMERLMDTSAPDLEFVHSGYKVIGNTYRYFFGIRNSGLASYTDPVMLSLYNNGKVIFTHTYTFASDPIRASGGRSFYVDTDAKATRFEFALDFGHFESAGE